MKKTMIVATMFCAAAFASASADTIGWWRFDGEGPNVPNVANPGTLDGTIVSISNDVSNAIADPANVSFGTDSSKCPKVTSNLQADAPRIYDPLDGSVHVGGKTLSYDKPFIQGGVMIPYDDALALTTFTIQAMIRLPKNASSRTGYGSGMFPIAQFGKDQTEGWMFSVYNGYLFSRFTYKTTNGTMKANGQGISSYYSTGSNFPSLYDGKWHHVAMVFTTDGAKAICRMFVDGVQYAENRATDWQSWNYSGKLPLFIGAHPYNYARTFYGDIAEVRITNDATSKDHENNFLVPLTDGQGLADDDTALLLTFGDTSKFGFSENRVITTKEAANIVDTDDFKAYSWYAKNWNILNAAYMDPLIPEWSPYASKDNADQRNTAELRPQVDDSVRGEMLLSASGVTTNAARDVSSLRFTPVQTNKTYNYVTDAINLKNAYTLSKGSFTVESVFKADTFATTDTVTIFHSPFLLLCIYEGKVYARGYTSSYGGNQNLGHTSGPLVNDGKWHHAAVTWNGTKLALYVDGKFISEKSFTMYSGATISDTCLIGAKYIKWDGGTSLANSSQGFKGAIDAVRITRRVLETDEFLTSFSPKFLVDARFDDDTPQSFSSGVPAYVLGNGVGYARAGGTDPSNVVSRAGKVVDGSEKSGFGKALNLEGGYVLYPRSRLLERQDFTVEFFAKLSDLRNNSRIIALNWGDSVGKPIWTLYKSVGEAERLSFSSWTTKDGGVTTDEQKFLHLYRLTDDDRKWHHWAMTVQQTPTGCIGVSLYRDHVLVKSDMPWLVAGAGYKGQMYIPPEGTCLSIGGSAYTGMTIDNVRITPGVLDPTEFMGYESAGLMILLK